MGVTAEPKTLRLRQKMIHWLEHVCLLLSAAFPCGWRHLLLRSASVVTGVCLLLCLHWEAAAIFPALTLSVNSFSNAPQARRELRRLKDEARNKHAIAVIWAYWLGSKVLEAHIPSLSPGILQEPTLISSIAGMNDCS